MVLQSARPSAAGRGLAGHLDLDVVQIPLGFIAALQRRADVHLDEKTAKSGIAPTRAAATVRVIWLVDNALAPKRKPVAPPDGVS